VYEYTLWIAEQLLRFSLKMVGAKWQKSAPILSFGIQEKKGRVTVPHPKKDIPMGTLKSIERQSGIRFN